MAAQKTRAATQAINEAMLDLFFDEGWSKQRIADDPRYNRSPHTLTALIREAKLKGRVRRKKSTHDPRRRENWKSLSPAHIKVGVLVNRHMAVRDINPTQFGLLVGLTRNQVAMMGSGAYDLKLTALVRVCLVLDIEVTSVFRGMSPSSTVRAPVS